MRALSIPPSRAWSFIRNVEMQFPSGLQDALNGLSASPFEEFSAAIAVEFRANDVLYDESSPGVLVLRVSSEFVEELRSMDERVSGPGTTVAVFGAGRSSHTYRGIAWATHRMGNRLRLEFTKDGDVTECTPFVPQIGEAGEGRTPFEIDPDDIDRATRAHQEMCRQIAIAANDTGHQSVRVGRIPTDVAVITATQSGLCMSLVEVKTIQGTNAVKQTRLALGQILNYLEMVLELPKVPQLQRLAAHIVLYGQEGDIPASTRSMCAKAGVGLHVARTLNDARTFIESLPEPE